MNPQPNNPQNPNLGNNFRVPSDKTNERLCIIGFIMAVVNTLLVLLDGHNIAMGGLGYLIMFYCATRGLKTKKRNLAIASIILGTVSLVIFIVKLISNLE